MAATNSTTNLGLPQWEATDKPERTDFNTAMSDIDNTVAAHLAESASKHIKETGSNANGRYVKIDDGTMICMQKVTREAVMTIAYGSLYREEFPVTWTYPASFIDLGYVGVSGSYKAPFSYIDTPENHRTTYRGVRHTSSTEVVEFHFLAVGRWK